MTDFLWPWCSITLLTTFLWMSFACLLFATNEQSVRVFLPRHHTCAVHVQKHEQRYAIPDGLLHAISKAESGLKDVNGQLVAWPWTINVQGQGYYFPTKEAAIAAVRNFQAKGISSIDVGCMQVNLYYHPKAFRNLEEAFEPSHNVAYAARFLTGLKREHHCWRRAMAHYHSANPVYHIPYQRTVLRLWNRGPGGKNIGLGSETFAHQDHIRRLSTGKKLSLASASHLPVSSASSTRRKLGAKSSHVRRLALSQRK